MASINLTGQMLITDVNGGLRQINLSQSIPYTSDYEATYAVAKGATVVIYNVADTAVPVNPFTAAFLFPSLNLDLSIGIGLTSLGATSVWDSIPLTANQVFPLWRNSFFYNYVNGAATNIFAGTASGTVLKMSVSEPTGTTSGTVQLFLCS